ncbi:FAD-binding protein [Lactiplantibacillus garii]|uniref:Urocanate reductase n=1 Tax=Lactiplantibacillus garii TaxID=2306423 RepID=A0A426D3U3_9LACO|nr:FAD-binding protein [Lactiplantibacillus garii]RRK09234.1 FAD-binding protein [Lactiplantibacillus garii]
MKLLAIVGTTARKSYNRKLLQFMRNHFKSRAEIEVAEINTIPLFSEDAADLGEPVPVTNLADRIEQVDGVIFGVPEYDHAVTAALKSTLEWLSYHRHSLRDMPVMLVGTSLGIQGTSRAQDNLRMILNSPGVDAQTLNGNEFMLSFAGRNFDKNDQLVDSKTVAFLDQCFTNFQKMVVARSKQSVINQIKWRADYDVIVLGFGGAGATAARFAADNGAKVLLVDTAPYGHEGGNTRYAAQYIATGKNLAALTKYYQQLFAPLAVPREALEAYLTGMTKIPEYLKRYLDIEPVSWNREMKSKTDKRVSPMVEYPEFAGSETFDITMVNHKGHDAGLWKVLRQQVLKRQSKIDVWLNSTAKKLIQNPETKVIQGVMVERNHQNYNIHAKNGVVLATGGFENNPSMIQTYLKYQKLTPIGTLYNQGAGLRLAQSVGARMWHMANYESHGILPGLTFAEKPGERGRQIRGWRELNHGSVFVIADDGSRYFDETAESRHGHIKNHGHWDIPMHNDHPYLIFDQAQYDRFKRGTQSGLPYPHFFDKLVSAPTIEKLNRLLQLPEGALTTTVAQFNRETESGHQDHFGRATVTMNSFSQGPFYAIALANDVLNTQGGPERNADAQIIGLDGQPIPHLYGAGELGGICGNRYQGGGNLAECLIFGKIAGENAATSKRIENDVTVEEPLDSINDLVAGARIDDIPLDKNQYLGKSANGIGGQLVVRVTYAEQKIQNVEVVQEHESEDVGKQALKLIPAAITANNSTDVDAVSGASATSTAIKYAVQDALKQVN